MKKKKENPHKAFVVLEPQLHAGLGSKAWGDSPLQTLRKATLGKGQVSLRNPPRK